MLFQGTLKLASLSNRGSRLRENDGNRSKTQALMPNSGRSVSLRPKLN